MSVPSLVKLAPNMDMNTLVNALNTNFNQIQAESRRKVVTDENGIDRIVIGKLESGDYGIEVSNTGYDVDTATDGEKVMSSQWMMWKIINSDEMELYDVTKYRRSGNLTLSATNVGYISDIIIPIENLDLSVGYGQTFQDRLQVFVRDFTSKQDLARSGIYRISAGDWFFIKHEYFIQFNTNFLVIRTIVRWMSGTTTFTPRTMALLPAKVYWEIANPTREQPYGGGGVGPTTTTYIYMDAVKYNPKTKTFGSLYSTTFQIPDTASYNRYSIDYAPVPPISMV